MKGAAQPYNTISRWDDGIHQHFKDPLRLVGENRTLFSRITVARNTNILQPT